MVKWLRGISAKTHRLISVRWDEELVTKEFVDIAHSRGLKVVVWTVNDVDSAWAAFGRGVDYVCTDRPLSLWKEMR